MTRLFVRIADVQAIDPEGHAAHIDTNEIDSGYTMSELFYRYLTTGLKNTRKDIVLLEFFLLLYIN